MRPISTIFGFDASAYARRPISSTSSETKIIISFSPFRLDVREKRKGRARTCRNPRAPPKSLQRVSHCRESLARVLALRAGDPLAADARALAGHETNAVTARELQCPLVAVARRTLHFKNLFPRHTSSPQQMLRSKTSEQ